MTEKVQKVQALLVLLQKTKSKTNNTSMLEKVRERTVDGHKLCEDECFLLAKNKRCNSRSTGDNVLKRREGDESF